MPIKAASVVTTVNGGPAGSPSTGVENSTEEAAEELAQRRLAMRIHSGTFAAATTRVELRLQTLGVRPENLSRDEKGPAHKMSASAALKLITNQSTVAAERAKLFADVRFCHAVFYHSALYGNKYFFFTEKHWTERKEQKKLPLRRRARLPFDWA